MDTPRNDSRCKVCALFIRNKPLWHEVHERSFFYRYPNTDISKWLNTQIVTLNEGVDETDPEFITEFSPQNLQRHFKSHVASMDEVHEVMSNGFPARKEVKQRKARAAQLKLPPVGEPTNDYLRLYQLVTAAEHRLEDYEKRYQADKDATNARGEKFVIELDEIQTFQKLIKDLMGMKKELVAFQTRAAIAGNAVREGIELVATQTMAQLKDSLVEMETNLGREMAGSSLPKQMNSLVLNKTGNFVKDLVPKILEEINKRYKIQ